jgi:hypothetical protein
MHCSNREQATGLCASKETTYRLFSAEDFLREVQPRKYEKQYA